MNDECTTWAWLATDEGEAAIASMPMAPTTAQITAMRKRMSAEHVRAVSDAMRSRVKGVHKLDTAFAERMIADLSGTEMASSAVSSRYKAERFVSHFGNGAIIADLCCGIGGDSWGLGKAGLVPIGVDSNPLRAWMYRHNTGFDTVCGDALDECPTAVGFHLDPARRTDQGTRTLDVEDFLPGPSAWDQLIQRYSGGAIKLNPGVNAYDLPAGEVEILSEVGGLTQAVLWVGNLAGEHERRATKLGLDGSVCSIHGDAWRPGESNKIGAYLGTLDPCLERADLVGEFLEQTSTSLVHPGTGMVTSEEMTEHPMVRWHKVYDVLPWNRKRVKAALRKLDHGIVEVRTRGRVINPDVEQKQLRGKGTNNRMTVLIYRIDQKLVAVIAERGQRETLHKMNPVQGEEKGC